MDIEQVLKLKLEPGDVLVVKSDNLCVSDLAEMAHMLAEKLGFRPAIILMGLDEDISVRKASEMPPGMRS